MHHGFVPVRTCCIDGLAVMLCTFAWFDVDGFAHVLLGGLGRSTFAHNAPVVAVPVCTVSARAVVSCHHMRTNVVSRVGALRVSWSDMKIEMIVESARVLWLVMILEGF